MDFLLGALLVSVVKRVDHALSHAHPDAVTVIFAKAGRFRDAQTHLLGQIDALHLRLQRDFEMLGARSHVSRCSGPASHKVNAIMGNTAEESESMDAGTRRTRVEYKRLTGSTQRMANERHELRFCLTPNRSDPASGTG